MDWKCRNVFVAAAIFKGVDRNGGGDSDGRYARANDRL